MSEALRKVVHEQADGRCEYCRLPDRWPPLEPFHLEHIMARQHGGLTALENLAWACHRCNRHKGTNLSAVDPDTGHVVPLFHPRRDLWREYFILDGFRIRGLTATGRATAWLLQMNAERRVERRAELILQRRF
ncbi:MAG: HNH endonuclease [Pedosphaera sp.]|nr:HNH endonuclease [Pedosphaera sp.]